MSGGETGFKIEDAGAKFMEKKFGISDFSLSRDGSPLDSHIEEGVELSEGKSGESNYRATQEGHEPGETSYPTDEHQP